MSASWHGPAQFAGVALVATVAAMWAAQPPAGCVMRSEPRRHLNLDRTVDREHLATDLADAERIARRDAAPREPSAGSHEPSIHADGQGCRDSLVRQIMAAHDLTPAQMVAATSRPPG